MEDDQTEAYAYHFLGLDEDEKSLERFSGHLKFGSDIFFGLLEFST